MRSRLSLRFRFVAAVFIIMTFLAAGFIFSIFHFIEIVELEFGERVLTHELGEFADAYKQNPLAAPPRDPELHGFIARPDALSGLPPDLAGIAPGESKEVLIEGIEYLAGRQDVGTTRLYLVMNNERMESLETQLIMFAAVLVAATIMVSLAAGFALSHLVTGPVSDLARLVSALDPSSRGLRLHGQFGDPDVECIAAAFDHYLERLDEFVTREQAFTDDTSHELRTPLAVIMSATDLLREQTGLAATSRERLARIHRAAQRMNGVVEALLLLAREQADAHTEICDLTEIVRDAIDANRDAAASKSLTLHAEIAAPIHVAAPSSMVYIMVTNLIDNAIHHTEYGRINVRLEPGRLVVQDTGAGIAASDLARVFDRGFRSAQSHGRGLGLYLVKRIAERLGWWIAVQSDPGVGTRFDVTFSAMA